MKKANNIDRHSDFISEEEIHISSVRSGNVKCLCYDYETESWIRFGFSVSDVIYYMPMNKEGIPCLDVTLNTGDTFTINVSEDKFIRWRSY